MEKGAVKLPWLSVARADCDQGILIRPLCGIDVAKVAFSPIFASILGKRKLKMLIPIIIYIALMAFCFVKLEFAIS